MTNIVLREVSIVLIEIYCMDSERVFIETQINDIIQQMRTFVR